MDIQKHLDSRNYEAFSGCTCQLAAKLYIQDSMRIQLFIIVNKVKVAND